MIGRVCVRRQKNAMELTDRSTSDMLLVPRNWRQNTPLTPPSAERDLRHVVYRLGGVGVLGKPRSYVFSLYLPFSVPHLDLLFDRHSGGIY